MGQPNRSPIYWVVVAGSFNWHAHEFSPTVAGGIGRVDGEPAVEKRRSSVIVGDVLAVG